VDKQELIKKLQWLQRYKARLIAEKGLKDLYFFNREILERDHPERQKNIVPHVHREWWLWFRGVKKRHRLILVPRGTLKTTFFTVGFTLQQLAKDRNVRILIANAKLDNAIKFLAEIKRAIQGNEAYIENYGELYDPKRKWTETEIGMGGGGPEVREPAVRAAGAGGGLAGMHWDWIIGDDLVNEVNSTTREQANKVIEWWQRSMSLLDPNGGSLTIGTCWNYYDLYQYIQENLKDKVAVFKRTAYNRDGTAYYPEVLSLEKLEELKKLESSFTFSSFYLNDPIDEENVSIGRELIHYEGSCPCGKYHRKPSELFHFMMCDPASSESKRADESAIVVVGADADMNWWVEETRHGRWKTSRLIEELFSVYNTWKPEGMSVEMLSQAKHLEEAIHQEEIRRNQFLPFKVIESREGMSKKNRIDSWLQPLFKRGKVFIKKDMKALEDQLVRYPKSKHDDLIDALADCAQIVFYPGGGKEEEHEPATLQEIINYQLREDREVVDPWLGENW